MASSILTIFIGFLPLVMSNPLPAPTRIPVPSQAQQHLGSLTVLPFVNVPGYDRDFFPTWEPVSGACNVRETVLKRDGTGVKTDSACKSTAGRWYSPYDGRTLTRADDVDIDHMVPLKNAWISGAFNWTASQRKAFANDLVRPQLWAVYDRINHEKSDQSPDKWKPPLTSFYCTYASAWVAVKSHWRLTVTPEEKNALESMLGSC